MSGKIFISGVNGFIGNNLARYFIHGGFDVVGIGRKEKSTVDGVKYLQSDILDADKYSHLVSGSDLVVHLAATTFHDEIVKNPTEAFWTSWFGTWNILKAFSAGTGRHFLYASTGKVYGDAGPLPFREEITCRPLNILGFTKYTCEHLVDFFSRLNQQKSFSVARIFNVYGKGQRDSFLIPAIIKQIKDGNKIIGLGDIKAKRDYVYIDDVVSAVSSIMFAGGTGLKIFNVGSGNSYSAEDIVKLISRITGDNLGISGDFSKKRIDELDEEYCSYDKLAGLGWKPHTLEDGLREMLMVENDTPSSTNN